MKTVNTATDERYVRDVPLPKIDRGLKVEYFLSFPRPLSGLGPATVSSHNLSSRLIVYSFISHTKGSKSQNEWRLIFIEGKR